MCEKYRRGQTLGHHAASWLVVMNIELYSRKAFKVEEFFMTKYQIEFPGNIRKMFQFSL